MKEIDKDKVNVVSLIPQVLHTYCSTLKSKKRKLHFESLNFIILTGERIQFTLINEFYSQYENVQLINAYGQSECSDDTFHFHISKKYESKDIPIGQPIKNINAYILDESLNPVSSGTVGELFISGIGLAKGYLNNEKLTNEKFFKRNIQESVLYRTGDIVKANKDGDYVYLGRKDNQVKINGHRIELEEIESNICCFAGVLQCVVVVNEIDGFNKILEAYYISEKNIDHGEIYSFLTQRIPMYMIPVKYNRASSFPCLSNGKVDRAIVENINCCDQASIDNVKNLSATQNEVLNIIKKKFSESLPSDFNIDRNLLDMGINSIMFVTIAVCMEEAFEFEFDDEMLIFTAFPTIRSLLEYVEFKSTNNK